MDEITRRQIDALGWWGFIKQWVLFRVLRFIVGKRPIVANVTIRGTLDFRSSARGALVWDNIFTDGDPAIDAGYR